MGAYSIDLRTRVLADWDAGMKADDVAAKYRVSRAWVHRLVQRRRETGEIEPRRQTKFRARTLATEIVAAGPFYEAEGYHQDYYKKNPVRFKLYKWNCGRDQRLEKVWG